MGFLRNKRYYFRVFFSIMAIFVLFTSLLVTGIYYNMRNYVASMENKKSELILSQMKYNLEYINDMIRDICISAYLSTDTKVLMYLEGDETYNEMSLINRINALRVRSNSLIHSIHVYNNNKKVLYSTFHSFKADDEECMNIINNTHPLPILKPVMRNFHDKLTGESTPVLSYFMYDLIDSNNVMDGGIVVNVDVKWLMNSVVELNEISSADEKIYVYSLRDHSFLDSGKEADQAQNEMQLIKNELDGLAGNFQTSAGLVPSFDIDINGSKYFVSYVAINNTDWILIKVQPGLTLKEYFNKIYISIITIAGIALLLGTLAYYAISRRLYKPVLNIMNMLPADGKTSSKDEFEIIHNTFEQYAQELDMLKSKYSSYSDIAKSFFLRSLLLDSPSVKAEDISNAGDEYNLKIDVTKPISICLVRINGYKNLANENILEDAKLAKFAVQNITAELCGRRFPCETIDMEGDYFVLIQNSGSLSQTELASLFREIQSTCLSKLNISLSITISKTVQNYSLLTDLYNKTVYNSNYRVILGSHSIIYDEYIDSLRLSNDTRKVFRLQDKLMANLNEPMDIIHKNINAVFAALKELEYYSIVFSVVRMQKIILEVINNINGKNTDSVIELPYFINYNTLESSSLDEIKEELISILSEIKSKDLPGAKYSNTSSIALSVKSMIDREYSDVDLNASKISDILNISSSRLSSIFNRYMNMTIPEYLNNVRLMRAVELLKNSDHSISTIMQMVGINNESYFYRLFKTKYKMTPREYAASLDITDK